MVGDFPFALRHATRRMAGRAPHPARPARVRWSCSAIPRRCQCPCCRQGALPGRSSPRIVTGNPFPIISYPVNPKDCEEELRKKITTFLLLRRSDRALFDNLDRVRRRHPRPKRSPAQSGRIASSGPTGNSAGRSQSRSTGPATTSSFLAPIPPRRICHIRLESPHERPEERAEREASTPYQLGDGEPRTTRSRKALTILSAYHQQPTDPTSSSSRGVRSSRGRHWCAMRWSGAAWSIRARPVWRFRIRPDETASRAPPAHHRAGDDRSGSNREDCGGDCRRGDCRGCCVLSGGSGNASRRGGFARLEGGWPEVGEPPPAPAQEGC